MDDTVALIAGKLGSSQMQELREACTEINSLIVSISNNSAATLARRKRRPAKLDEFLVTQDSFAFNLAGRIALRLDWVLKCEEADVAVALMQCLRGLCLVHRQSRLVFDNDHLMKLLIDGIESKDPQLQQAFINATMAILVHQVANIRRFEALDGLRVVCNTFKRSYTPKQSKLTLLQFLFFYLIPETRVVREQYPPRKTTKDKQEMLGRYLSNVDGLVRQLETLQPFETAEIEW